MTPTFQLRLFGAPSIEGPEGPLSGAAAQPRRLALLARLALADRRRLTRDKLAATFWPESDAERARHSLAHAVYVLRRALGEEALRSEGDDLVLDAARVGCDVEAFRRDLARDDPERAASRYAGPFLDGFHVSRAPEFERWVDAERDRLAAEHARAVERLARRAEAAGRPLEAAAWWRRLAAGDPLNTRAVRGLMEALAAAGDRAGAIRHAERHAELLASELGAAPDPDVAALAERLRSAPVDPGRSAGEPSWAGATPNDAARGDPVTDRPEGAPPPPSDAPPPPSDAPPRASDAPPRARGASPRPEPPPGDPSRRPWPALAAVAAGALLVVAASVFTGTPERASAGVDDRIIVLPFRSPAGDPELDDAGALAAGLLAEGLARVDLGDVVLPLELATSSDVPAGLTVRGTVHRAGDSLVFVTTLLGPDDGDGSGQVIAALPALRADPADPTPALGALRDRLVGAVASHLGREPPVHPFVVPTPTWASYRIADRATRRFLNREFEEAAALYREAWETDPATAAYRLWEAISHANLGRWERVTRRLDELRPRRSELNGFEAAEFDWLEATTYGDRAAALEAARTARAHAPHCGLGGYQLGVELYRNGLAEEALEVLESLEPDRGWLADWAPYWHRLALVRHLLGRHEEELEAAEEGYVRHPGPRMLVARLRALATLGRIDALRALLRTSPESSPDAYRRAAWTLHIHGRPEEAAEIAREGLRALRSARPARTARLAGGPGEEDEPAPIGERLLEARLLFMADSLPAARDRLETLAGEAPGSAIVVGWWGVVEARLGNRARATEALRRLDGLEDRPFVRGLHTAWRAAIETELGAPPERIRSLLLQAHRQGVGLDGYHLTPLFDRVRGAPELREIFAARR